LERLKQVRAQHSIDTKVGIFVYGEEVMQRGCVSHGSVIEVEMAQKKISASQRPSRRSNKTGVIARIVVENVNHPGKRRPVDAANYQAMRRTLLKVLPARSPGLTLAEAFRAVVPHLPDDLFPGGAKAGWWMKAVQLDLEAKGIITREKTKPLRLHRS
jgi:hypothetical protein